MLIREHQLVDKAFLREMLESAALPTYEELASLGRLSRRERLDQIFAYYYEHPNKRIWVAENEAGRPLGAIWLQPSHHPVTELADYLLLNLAVTPAARGQGLARQLVATARAHCVQANVRRMRLFVGSENEAAYALYRSLGFEEQTREMLWRF